MSYWNSDRG